jgi:excisionase family DNA binding protein
MNDMELLTQEAAEVAFYKEKLEELRSSIELILKHFRPVLNGEIYLSGQDVCELLHISRRTLQQYRDDKILPFIQIGGKIIFKRSDITSVLEQNYVINR